MSYQALLFCADEKLARVVTQVFTELEFNVEPVNEPFSAVKKLMAQHYDALVVDCESEQNASLLFKSARNSGTNQNSLALALVEGQAGVAKAYRIGANLVLTKPINVEQAKGTLRVARGLLRKNADNAASTASQSALPVPPAAPTGSSAKAQSETSKPAAFTAQPERPAAAVYSSQSGKTSASETPAARPEPAFAVPEFEAVLPAMAASAKAEKPMPSVPRPTAEISAATPPTPKVEAAPRQISKPEPVSKPASSGATQAKPAGFGTFQSAAAAPAPARDVIIPAKEKASEADLFETTSSKPQPAEEVAPPTFSAFGDQTSEGSGSSKIFLVIAAAIAIVIGLGYFGWTKFGSSSTAAPSTNAMQKSQPVQAPAANPPTAPSASNLTNAATLAAPAVSNSVVTGTQAAKPHPGVTNAPVPKIAVGQEEAANPEVVTKNLGSAPMHVKHESQPIKVATQADEATPALPNPLGVGSGNYSSLASLVSGPAKLPVAPAGTLRISQGVSQGLLIKKVQPSYPQNARAMRIEGPVQMQALIDKEGKITNLKVLKGQPVLAQAAVNAVRQWRYKPYYLDGEPVEIQTEITVVFKLPN